MMSSALIASFVFAQTQINVAKEHLFIPWTTTPIIANVTIGLPDADELHNAATLLAEVRAEITDKNETAESLFLQGMLAGIEMEHKNAQAEVCQEILDTLGSDMDGIAGSRVLRMQLRCAQLLGDVTKATQVAEKLRAYSSANIEDLAVLNVFDIEQAMLNGDLQLAQNIYVSFDSTLRASSCQYLRIPFAHGYARISETPEDAVFAWFSLSSWLLEYGYDQELVDELLLTWLERLRPDIAISSTSKIPQVAQLANRLATDEPENDVSEFDEVQEMVNNRELSPTNLKMAFVISNESNLPVRMVKKFNPSVIQDLLKQGIAQSHKNGINSWREKAFTLLLEDSDSVDLNVLAETHRLLGNCEKAIPLFMQVMDTYGKSVQTVAGLACCTRDAVAMRDVVQSTSPEDSSAYWYWLANLQMLQWHIADGGDRNEVIAKINRLRKKDASLGGAQFISQFNKLLR